MILIELILAVGLGVLIGLLFLNTNRDSSKQKQLDEAFYRLLKTQNGRIALIQIAAAARVDASEARDYLDRQAKAFSATMEVDADGDVFYRFPKLRLPDNR